MKKKLQKLLLFSPYFPSHIGGVEMYTKNIAEGLVKNYGIEVVVISSNHTEKRIKVEMMNGIKVYRLPILFTLSNTPVNPFWYREIKHIIAIEKPDIINAHAPVPLMADITALASGNIPFILTYHTGRMKKSTIVENIVLTLYEKFVLSYTCRKAKKIICTSPYVKNKFLYRYTKKTVVISPGVDTKLFKPKKNKDTNRILFVGSLKKAEKYKGVTYLLKSFALFHKRYPKIKLHIVGDGDAKDEYMQLAKILHIEKFVTFSGTLQGKELISAYQHAEVLVLPSLFESFGMVLIEAMACAVPVIGTMIGGIPHVIDDTKNGLLIEAGNVHKLTGALLAIFKNPLAANQMGKNGLRKVQQQYTWDIQVKKTNAVMAKVFS